MFASIPEILDDLRAGKIIILVDDEDRENEGDFVVAAEKVTPEAINFMARFGRGLICLTLTRERCDRIVGIPLVGSVESLNVAVAAGVCLYATRVARSRR